MHHETAAELQGPAGNAACPLEHISAAVMSGSNGQVQRRSNRVPLILATSALLLAAVICVVLGHAGDGHARKLLEMSALSQYQHGPGWDSGGRT
eukprot:982523-Rhodomonas_salina.2